MSRPRSAVLLFLCCSIVPACDRGLPGSDSPDYTEAVRAFHTAVAAVQAGENAVARAAFGRVTELAPGEPAGWADLGLVAYLQGRSDTAATYLRRARDLMPTHPRIQTQSGLVALARGDAEAAREHLERAVELAPDEPLYLALLAGVVEAEEGPGSAAEAGALYGRILERAPGNLAALAERARLAAKAEQPDALQSALSSMAATEALPQAARDRLETVRQLADSGEYGQAAVEVAFLVTELAPDPSFRAARDRLELSPGRTELLVPGFLRLPVPPTNPAAADTTLRFERDTLQVGGHPAAWVRALWLHEEVPLAMAAADTGGVWVGGQTGSGQVLPAPDPEAVPTDLHALDYDYDFRTDLAITGSAGLRLFRNAGDTFVEVTGTALPELQGAYAGVWAADLDMEGDMDLVAARTDGPPTVLMNTGDGRFETAAEFQDVVGVRDFAWADLDADGDPDAALLDAAGHLHVYGNRRFGSPRFVSETLARGPSRYVAVAVADLDQDAVFELLLMESSGRLTRMKLDGPEPEAVLMGEWPGHAGSVPGEAELLVHDLDNNGELDVVAASAGASHVWLGSAGALASHRMLDVQVTDAADVNGDGLLDLIAVGPDHTAWWLDNRAQAGYSSVTLRPRAVRTAGDRRINSFGIGGEVEIRAGLLYQKQPIRGGTVHLGLGEWPQADVARIVWPNGTVQAEFNVAAEGGSAVARQRLKGSCPWVFTYDGQGMRFVTDFLWRTALGLRINAQGGAAVIHGEDWIRIPEQLLQPRDGFYDVRITAELWETHFFDHVSLLVVDHAADTEVLVDERFTIPQPPQTLHTTGPLQPVAAARDHTGRDATMVLRDRDGTYLDTFERGPYQGVAEEHFVEVELPESAPRDRSLALVASGWVYPTDSSINLAIAQGAHPPPRGIRVEAPDGHGGWVVVRPDFGFPAGKSKTIVLDLEDAFPDPDDRRLRLRTNMEIYWDRIAWAESRPEARLETERLLPVDAELLYRGFSEVHAESRSTPERPEYDRIATTAPIWRDLVGYHTRFGDVEPLTRAVDDRYVIMNAGDELRLRFAALPAPAPDRERTFVLVGDGWVKDGDYNTGFSTTVRPLPYHGLTDYSTAPGRLEDDPGYRAHPNDWSVYHTRYVTPEGFQDALLPRGHD